MPTLWYQRLVKVRSRLRTFESEKLRNKAKPKKKTRKKKRWRRKRTPKKAPTSDRFPSPTFGTVYETDEVVTQLVRAENGDLVFQHRLKSDLSAEEASVFLGAGRRGKANPHPSFETILDASKTGYDTAFLAAERLEQLHTSALYSGDNALPSTLVLRVAVDLLSALAHCHEQGQVNGPFTIGQVVLGIDGRSRLTGRALSALATHRSGTLATSVSDLKSLVGLITALLPNDDSMEGVWPDIRVWLDNLKAEHYDDGVEALSGLGDLADEAAQPDHVVRWLDQHYASRLKRWAALSDTSDPSADVKDLLSRVPVREKPEPIPAPTPVSQAVATSGGEVGRRPKPGLIADGTEPDLFAERDEDALLRRQLDMDQLLDGLEDTEATGDPNSALVLEVTRVVRNVAMQTELVHVGQPFQSGDGLTATLEEDTARITLPDSALVGTTATVRKPSFRGVPKRCSSVNGR